MNIASALIKQVIVLQDFDTWSSVRRDYLPTEYHSLFSIIDKHTATYHSLPTFEELKFSIRDSKSLEKLYAIETVQVEADASMLLEYLKNEYTQKEILDSLETYIDNSVAFENAEESVTHLHQIVLDVEKKVDLQPPQESMQRISLFEEKESLENYLTLGLNSVFDSQIRFSPRDLVLIGGKRGSGKSLTCANIANSVYESGKSAMYFTIEMDKYQTLQRVCAIATGIQYNRIRNRELSDLEWIKVASWWAGRFENSDEILEEFKTYSTEDNAFDDFHYKLRTTCELLPTQQVDVIYDPALTLAKIKAEMDKKVKALNVGVVLVDYINQVKRSAIPSRQGQYDWMEQIEVSKTLKSLAQEYECAVVTPYQTDATGEARFAKGILDAADAAFALQTYKVENAPNSEKHPVIHFENVKMRSHRETDFTSVVDWETMRIGPESALIPSREPAKEDDDDKQGEAIDDI